MYNHRSQRVSELTAVKSLPDESKLIDMLSGRITVRKADVINEEREE